MRSRIAFPLAFVFALLIVAPAGAANSEETAVPIVAPEPLFLVEPIRCVCRCTCPSSGSFEYQCREITPTGEGGCGVLNGQSCNPNFSLCNQPEIFQGCIQAELAPVPCVL